jgi:hypothetical protein
VRLGRPCVNRSGVAEREGFEPSTGLLPNRISNWTQKRDQRGSAGVLKSDAGVSRNPEAVQSICGSTQSSTQKQHRPHQMVEAV